MRFKQKMKKEAVRSLVSDIVKTRCNFNLSLSLFENAFIEWITNIVIKAPKKAQQELLSDLQKHHTKKLKLYLKKTNPVLLEALNDLCSLKNTYTHRKKIHPQTTTDILTSCLVSETSFLYPAIEKTLSQMPFIPFDYRKRALKNLFQARVFFFKTDLKKASKILFKNIKMLEHSDFDEELAYNYFMLGEIYRTCCLFDSADMMFRTSLQIYQNINHSFGTRFILSAHAFNALQAGRTADAESSFKKVLCAFQKQKDTLHEAEILNQLAVLSNMNGDFKKAQRLASRALQKHTLCVNPNGIAFSHRQIAVSAKELNRLPLAKKHASKAKQIYKTQQNHSAVQDMSSFLKHI